MLAWWSCGSNAFLPADGVHALTCALMLLNTDLHGHVRRPPPRVHPRQLAARRGAPQSRRGRLLAELFPVLPSLLDLA